MEALTWAQIERQTHGKYGKSSSHYVPISKLDIEMRKRLKDLSLDDIDEIFSLRLDGLYRIYGVRKFNVLQIIFFDKEHEGYQFAD